MKEKEIINFLIEGKNKNEIAAELNLSRSEVEIEINKIYEKYQVNNRIQLAIAYNHNSKVN